MAETVNWWGRTFTVPPGYTHRSWNTLQKGDTVFIVGTSNKRPCCYGPHTVHDPERRQLKNPRSGLFVNPCDDLVVPITEDFTTKAAA